MAKFTLSMELSPEEKAEFALFGACDITLTKEISIVHGDPKPQLMLFRNFLQAQTYSWVEGIAILGTEDGSDELEIRVSSEDF